MRSKNMALNAESRLVQIRVMVNRAERHLNEFDRLAETFQGEYSHIEQSKAGDAAIALAAGC